MALDYEESKNKIVEKLQKKLKTKSKFYFNDLAKILEAKAPRGQEGHQSHDTRKRFWNTGPAAARHYTDLKVPETGGSPKTRTRAV